MFSREITLVSGLSLLYTHPTISILHIHVSTIDFL